MKKISLLLIIFLLIGCTNQSPMLVNNSSEVKEYINSKKQNEGNTLLHMENNEITIAEYNYDGDEDNHKIEYKKISSDLKIFQYEKNNFDINIKELSIQELEQCINNNECSFAYLEYQNNQIIQIIVYGETINQ